MLLFILTLTKLEYVNKTNQYIVDQVSKLNTKDHTLLDPCNADLAKMENYDMCINSLSNDIKQLSKITKLEELEQAKS